MHSTTYFVFNATRIRTDRFGFATDFFMTTAPGQALEKYQQMFQQREGDDQIVIARSLDPKMFFEQQQVRKRIVNEDQPEIDEASERQDLRIARPGQFPPVVAKDFTEVHSRGRNDCPVVAAANLFQLSYADAKVQCFQNGWSSTSGLTPGLLELLAEEQGFDCYYRPDLSDTYCDHWPEPAGLFIVRVANHVMASVNGRLCNLQDTGWQRITEVFELQPKDDSAAH
jgi:hypothetical protein